MAEIPAVTPLSTNDSAMIAAFFLGVGGNNVLKMVNNSFHLPPSGSA
jgi:hypothetical protein